ncbi:microtubule associated protein-domain-containing protein [Chytriomyces sp. MP71]|nr:microtubule associated protein-domain-containing protein [Chytriomyces sp. MP71]
MPSRLARLQAEVAAARSALEDLGEEEVAVQGAGENLSATTVDAWARALYALEEERDRRQNAIARVCAGIYRTVAFLGGEGAYPCATEQEANLRDFLQTPMRGFGEEDAGLPVLPASAGSLEVGEGRVFKMATLQRHYKTLLQETEGGSSMVHMSVTRSCIRWLEGVLGRLETQLKAKRETCRAIVKEIEMCRDELDLDKDETEEFKLDAEDLERLEEYEKIASDLRIRWRSKMQEVVVRLLLDLTTWWDKCYVLAEDRKSFTNQFGDNLFSPLTVERIRLELLSLQARHESEQHLYERIEARADLLARMVDFEKSASDPRRLFRSSFQLNEEERFRKSCVPSLLRLEQELRDAVAVFEQDHGRAFNFRGIRYLATLDQETSDRFLNEAVFLFDTSSLSISRPKSQRGHTGSPKVTPRRVVGKAVGGMVRGRNASHALSELSESPSDAGVKKLRGRGVPVASAAL